jgi:hypothetical protein
VREIEPAAVPRQRLSRSWAIGAAPVGIAGLFLVLVAAVIAASLVGSGLGRSQAGGAIPSATAPSSVRATAQATASNHLDSAQPSLGTSLSRTGGFEPASKPP